MKSKKPQAEKAVRTTISMPLVMFAGAVSRQKERKLTNFSAYIQSLVVNDEPKREAA